jgi:hypothetical protein
MHCPGFNLILRRFGFLLGLCDAALQTVKVESPFICTASARTGLGLGAPDFLLDFFFAGMTVPIFPDVSLLLERLEAENGPPWPHR